MGEDKGTITCNRDLQSSNLPCEATTYVFCKSSQNIQEEYRYSGTGDLKSDIRQHIPKPTILDDNNDKIQLNWGEGRFWLQLREYLRLWMSVFVLLNNLLL